MVDFKERRCSTACNLLKTLGLRETLVYVHRDLLVPLDQADRVH